MADQGRGLDMKEADRVMRPFERGDAARTGVSGTGLGLAIVDRIARRSSGTVDLSTTDPHGLTVSIRIPLFNEKKAEAEAAEDAGKNAPSVAI